MAKLSGLYSGFSGLQLATVMEGAVWGAIRQEHLKDPAANMEGISMTVMANFGIENMSPKAVLAIYYRLENHFLGKGYAEDDTENATQSTDQ